VTEKKTNRHGNKEKKKRVLDLGFGVRRCNKRRSDDNDRELKRGKARGGFFETPPHLRFCIEGSQWGGGRARVMLDEERRSVLEIDWDAETR